MVGVFLILAAGLLGLGPAGWGAQDPEQGCLERVAFPHVSSETMDQKYQSLLGLVNAHGFREYNQRTGVSVTRYPNVSVRFDLRKEFPLLQLRELNIKTIVAEHIWFLIGDKSVKGLEQFTKIWSGFANTRKEVDAAYGNRWREYFGRDQFQSALDKLILDPSTRQAHVCTWDPKTDGLADGKVRKNTPCVTGFTLNLIGKEPRLLNLDVHFRSNDMVLGHPSDVAGFALLSKIFAQHLNNHEPTESGLLTVTISDAHFYGPHEQAVAELLKREPSKTPVQLPPLPRNSFIRATYGDWGLVEEIVESLKPRYQPQDPIPKLRLIY